MQYVAIDPMALMLSEKAYLMVVEIRHPNTPLTSGEVAKVFGSMNAQEKKVSLARAQALIACGRAIEAAAGKRG
jgi:hypothetical protein